MKKRDSLVSILIVSFVSVFVLSIIAYGALSKSYTFVAGTVISSAEVNANFDDLFNAIGNQLYDEENYVADDQSVTASINALDIGLNTLSGDATTNKGLTKMFTADSVVHPLSDQLDQSTLTWDATTNKMKVRDATLIVPRGYIAGLQLSNVGDTSIDIATGVCRSTDDSTTLVLDHRLVKNVAVAWTKDGIDHPGGLDTGAVSGTTGYHVWLIKNVTAGTVDAIFSLSGVSPTYPSGYTKARRIGWVTLDGTVVKSFDQMGNLFYYKVPQLAIKDANVSNAASTTYRLPVPEYVRVVAHLNVYLDSTAGRNIYLFPTSVNDQEPQAAAKSASPIGQMIVPNPSANNITDIGGTASILTNTSGQIKARSRAGDSNGLYGMVTHWEDYRGQND